MVAKEMGRFRSFEKQKQIVLEFPWKFSENPKIVKFPKDDWNSVNSKERGAKWSWNSCSEIFENLGECLARWSVVL